MSSDNEITVSSVADLLPAGSDGALFVRTPRDATQEHVRRAAEHLHHALRGPFPNLRVILIPEDWNFELLTDGQLRTLRIQLEKQVGG